MSAALARALTSEGVADVVVVDAVDALGAEGGLLALRDGRGEARIVRDAGRSLALTGGVRRVPPIPGGAVAWVLRTGRARWLEDPQDPAAACGPPRRERFGCGAVVPLWVGAEVVGAIGFTFATCDGRVPGEARALLAPLADLCARAVARARSHRDGLDVPDAVAAALGAPPLPRAPGVRLAGLRVPSGGRDGLSGDWYDAAALPGGRIALIIGDVVGRGPAAAAVVGPLRAALRTLVLQGERPRAALSRLWEVARDVEGAACATACVCHLDVPARELRYACAGHPPPLVADRDGTCRFLWAGRGPLLGWRDDRPGGEASIRLHPGATLVMYTDGVVEGVGDSIDEGFVRLAGICADHPRSGLDELCARIVGLASRAGRHDDATALACRIR